MADREMVIQHFQDAIEASGNGNKWRFVRLDIIEKAISLLNEQDALLKEQEAKTGHWIEKEDYNLDTYYDCSVCGESWTMIDGTPWENGMNYCPHCGAKMEGR